MLHNLFKQVQYIAICALVFPLVAHAVEVTPLSDSGASLIDRGSTPREGQSRFVSSGIDNPHPDWVFYGLVPAATWDKYGKRPSAFAVTGTQPYDPASMALLSVPSGTKSSARRNNASTTRNAATSKTAATASNATSPYSGTAPSTGAIAGAGSGAAKQTPSAGTTGVMGATTPATTPPSAIVPSSGVTHTRAPSATQTNNELSAQPQSKADSDASSATSTETGGTVTGTIAPAAPAPSAPPVPATSTVRAASKPPAPNRPGDIAPKIVLPPNNGSGAMISPAQNS